MPHASIVWSAAMASLIMTSFLAVDARSTFVSTATAAPITSSGWIQKDSQSILSIESLRGGSMGEYL